MKKTTRRAFVRNTAAVAGGLCTAGLSGGVGNPLRDHEAERRPHRTHLLQLRGACLPHTAEVRPHRGGSSRPCLTVNCTVSTRAGKVGAGFGTMPLNYTFSFPSTKLSEPGQAGGDEGLAEEIAKVTGTYREFGHPIDINWELAPLYLKAAADVSRRLQLADPIPKLCTLVTAGAFDAAIHDAYGKAQGLNCYHTYGPDFMNHDLSYYLGAEYQGEYPSRYLRSEPRLGCRSVI